MKKFCIVTALVLLLLGESQSVFAASNDSDIIPPSTDALTCLKQTATPIQFTDTQVTVDGEVLNYDFAEENLSRFTLTAHPNERLIKGLGNNLFGSSHTLSRFELTKISLGANCIDWLSSPTPNTKFIDVPQDNSEMSLVVGKAFSQGIITGIGNYFYPQNNVTSGEFVKILFGNSIYFQHGEAIKPLSIKVTSISDSSFQQFAEHAERLGMINVATFSQNKLVLRYEMAEMLYQYITYMKKMSQCDYPNCR